MNTDYQGIREKQRQTDIRWMMIHSRGLSNMPGGKRKLPGVMKAICRFYCRM